MSVVGPLTSLAVGVVSILLAYAIPDDTLLDLAVKMLVGANLWSGCSTWCRACRSTAGGC